MNAFQGRQSKDRIDFLKCEGPHTRQWALSDVVHALPHLRGGGWLLLEPGYDLATAVRDFLPDIGLVNAQSQRNLNGIERCSGGRVPQNQRQPYSHFDAGRSA